MFAATTAPRLAVPSALKTPLMVDEPVTASAEVVAPVACKLSSVVRPVFDTEKSVVVAEAVEEPIANKVVLVSPLLAWIANLLNGEVVATPMLPVERMRRRSLLVL